MVSNEGPNICAKLGETESTAQLKSKNQEQWCISLEYTPLCLMSRVNTTEKT